MMEAAYHAEEGSIPADYRMSKKFCPFLDKEYTMTIGQYFLNIQYCIIRKDLQTSTGNPYWRKKNRENPHIIDHGT